VRRDDGGPDVVPGGELSPDASKEAADAKVVDPIDSAVAADASSDPQTDATADTSVDAEGTPAAPQDGGAPPPSCVPAAETCDHKDDDCDGVIDNGVSNACGGCNPIDPSHAVDKPCDNGGQGLCAKPGTWQCHAGTTVCNAPDPNPSAEVCDGKDNDCDGVPDDGITKNSCGGCNLLPHDKDDACDNGLLGECRLVGTYTCGADLESIACNAKPTSGTEEICDGKDNDCDGQTDEAVTINWYCDGDVDGFASSAAEPRPACTTPKPDHVCAGWTARKPTGLADTDCDDTNAQYRPGADYGVPSGNNTSNDLNCDGRTDVSPSVSSLDGVELNICTMPFSCDCYRPLTRNGGYLQEWHDWSAQQGATPRPSIPCSIGPDDKIDLWKRTSGPDKLTPEADCAGSATNGTLHLWPAHQRCR
jgi:hypothetical protein